MWRCVSRVGRLSTLLAVRSRPAAAPETRGRVCRLYSDLIPPTQFDRPRPRNLQLGYAMRVHWEIIPLILTAVINILLVIVALAWAAKHKMDVVYTPYNRDCISRRMDLRCPTVHKMMTVCQRYEPWPEMQASLDKMKQAERRLAAREKNLCHSGKSA